MTPLLRLNRGDLARWTSQARGTVRHHVGVVVLVVPGGVPIDVLRSGLAARYSLRPMAAARGVRADRSYVLAQLGTRSGGRARVYWPHASLLRPY